MFINISRLYEGQSFFFFFLLVHSWFSSWTLLHVKGGLGVWAYSSLLAIVSCVVCVFDPLHACAWRQKRNQRHTEEVCGARYYRATVLRPHWQSAPRPAVTADARLIAGIQQTRKQLEGCLGSLGIWIAKSVCPLHMWPTARSYICTPLWMRTMNFWDTSGESICIPSSMNGFLLWLTLLCSSFHSLETPLVSLIYDIF